MVVSFTDSSQAVGQYRLVLFVKLKSSFEFIIPERAAHEARKHPRVEVLDEAPHEPEGDPQCEEAEDPP